MVEVYVNSTNGVDEVGAGTQDKPFKTLDYAIKTTALTQDIIFYLDKGEYDYSNTSLDSAQKGRKFYIIGNGLDTTVSYKATTSSAIGTQGVDIYFRKFILILRSGTNPWSRNNNRHFENILFKDVPSATYGCMNINNPGSTMKNCVQNNIQPFIRSRKNLEITGCYGNFGGLTEGQEENPNNLYNKFLTSPEEIKLDEKYKITDSSVDTSKIGLYAGEYAWVEQDCLIKLNDKYYSILEEFWNTETKQFNEVGSLDFEKSFLLPDLTKQVTYGDDTFVPIDKFDNFSIVFKDENIKKLNINSYKIENKTVITDPIDLRMVENFNSLVINGNNVKCLMKFNEEEVFYKYNFEANTLETEELINISTNGIDISKVKDIDFNKIKEEKELKNITFAFYIEQDSVVNNIVIDYLEVGEFSQKTSTETKLKVGYKKITIQPTFSTNLLKINVL